MKRKILAFVLAFIMLTVPVLCSCEKDDEENGNMPADYKVTHTARIEIRGYGVIELELYGEEAPITVENFVSLANSGFYEGLTFHRIIDGFMMQGGGFDIDGVQKRCATIKGEFQENGVKNTIKHERGVISMARSNHPDSASSQFFIVHDVADWLDGAYAAFGRVTSGIEIVDKICTEAQPIDGNGSIAVSDRPIIVSVTVVAK